MKINIKTIKEEKFEVEAPDNATIGELKALIEQKFQHQKDWQILIFNGSILTDDRTLESIKLSEKDSLVLMIKKPREVKKPAAATPAPAAAPAAEKKPEGQATPAATPAAATPAKPAETPAATAATPAPGAAAPQGADFLGEASMMVSAEEANQMVTNLCEMGFPRDQVILALRASFFNPHRAVEYLFSGNIPAVAAPPPAAARPPAQAPAPATPATPAAAPAPAAAPGAPARAPAAAPGANPFDFLRQHPQFEQLRQIARQDPSQLEQLLTMMAENNPEMIPLISDNQEAFIRLLTSDEGAAPGGAPRAGAAPGQGGDPVITPGPRPGTVQVQVTQADMDSINNLVSMGFDRNRALEAYIVFGRNVDAAANYLLSNPDDDPMDFQGPAGGGGGDFGGFAGDDDDDDDDDDDAGEDGPTDF